MVPLALGTDTGGSIRVPSALCGVYGLKSSYGRVSLHGVLPLAPSLDHLGPLARTPDDLALALGVLAGPDPADPITMNRGRWEASAVPPRWRLAVAPDLHVPALRADHAVIFERSVAAAALALKTTVQEVAVPEAGRIRPAFVAIQAAEAHHVHTRLGTWPQLADQLGPDLVERFKLGALVGVEEYLAARATAQIASRRLALLFADVDVLLTPVMAGGPPSIERPDELNHRGATISFRDLVMGYTVPQNLTGCPSVVVPVGLDHDGLPVGLQVTAEWGREAVAIAAASAIGEALSGTVPAPFTAA